MTVTINGTNGVTTPEVVLDNSAADGAQVVLKSSGYSDWNLDNYSGRLRAYYGATEYLTVTSSGNVGIGTSSPSYKLQVAGRVSYSGAIGEGADTTLSSFGTSIRLAESATWTTLAMYTGGSERARIDSSGNLLVNTTSASGKLTVRGSDISDVPLAITHAWGSSSTPLITASNSSGEVMRIERSGNLLVGTTSGAFSSTTSTGMQVGQSGQILCSTTGTSAIFRITSTGTLVQWRYQGTVTGDVTTNGTTTAYNTSSDYRLKHDIAPMTGALAKVAALKPVTYKWNADNSESQGFIAHELQEVVPECVTGEKDAVDADGNPQYQGIDTSFLVATLTAAIQELKAINDAQAETITALTARVTALDTRLTSLEGTQP